MKNKKGFALGMKTIVIVVLGFTALILVSTFILRGFRGTGEQSQEVLEGAKEGTEDVDVGSELIGLGTDGKCVGYPNSYKCSEYYSTESGLTCDVDGDGEAGSCTYPVPSCNYIGAYSADEWGTSNVYCLNKTASWRDREKIGQYDYSGEASCMETASRPKYVRVEDSDNDGNCSDDVDSTLKTKYPDAYKDDCDLSCSTFTDAGKEVCEGIDGCKWETE